MLITGCLKINFMDRRSFRSPRISFYVITKKWYSKKEAHKEKKKRDIIDFESILSLYFTTFLLNLPLSVYVRAHIWIDGQITLFIQYKVHPLKPKFTFF